LGGSWLNGCRLCRILTDSRLSFRRDCSGHLVVADLELDACAAVGWKVKKLANLGAARVFEGRLDVFSSVVWLPVTK